MSLFPSATTIENAEEGSEVPDTGENQLQWLSNASYQNTTSHEATRSKLLKDVTQLAGDDHSELRELKNYEDKTDSWDRESGRSERQQRKESKQRKHHKRKRDDKTDNAYYSKHRESSGSKSKLKGSHKDKSRKRSRSRSRSRSRDREKNRSKDSNRNRSRSESREKPQRSVHRPSSIWLDDHGNMSDILFYIDLKPDRNNLCFDTLDYKDSAFYRTLGRTCLGGAHLNEAIFWSGKEKGKSKMKKVRKDRYFSRFVTAVSNDATVSLSNVKEDKGVVEKMSGFKDKMEVEIEAADPFIPVENKMKSKSLHSSEIDPLALYDKSTRQYLGIPTDSFDDGQIASSNGGTQVRNPITDQVAYFNRHLSENPQDTSKWMEFIHFQEELVKSTIFNVSSGKHGNLKTQEQLLAQRKLIILEKALERNPGCLELQLEQVEVCRDVWESSKVSDLWSKMLKDHRGNKDLWHHYLLFCKSFYSSFSISNISTIYAECIQSLLKRIDDDKEDSAVNEMDVFDIFIQLCHFWHQAGHTEKAIAAFQAMIELNFFCPEHLEQSTTLSAQLAFLETFWDSDEPKFGETGAKGWSHWMHLKEKGGWQQTAERSILDDEDDTTLDPSLSKVEAWLKEELARGHCHLLPWRPSKDQTADDCEDPDRLVLFDDISKVLFKLTGTTSKFQLILGLLELIGIQNEAPLTSNSSQTDNFLSTVLQSLQQLLHCKFALSMKSRDYSQESVISSWHSVWQKSCPGILRICEGMKGDVTAGIKSESTWTSAESKSLRKFVDNVIDQLIPKVSIDQQSLLRLMQLRFHLTNVILSKEPKIRKKQLKMVQKNAKRTLSLEDNRNNLAMWEAYALWEWGVGNRNEAQRILETALSFAGVPKTDSDVHDYTRLTHTVTTLKLYQLFIKSESGVRYHSASDQEENSDTLEREAINMLTTLGEGVRFVPLSQFHDGTVTSGRILKARKRFVELLEECKMEYSPIVGPSPAPLKEDSVIPSGSYLYHLSSCYALFQYLTVSLQASRVVFQEVLSFLDKVPVVGNDSKPSSLSPQKEIDYELLTVAEIQLVSFHSGVSPVPLTQLRSLLQKALSKYPTNSVLLEVFLQTERKSQVKGRLRRHFHHVMLHTRSPVPVLFAILGELRRHAAIQEASIDGHEVLMETGITHQIRSLFERAVRSQYTRHCILFWRMYIHFEVCQGNMKKAKSIFYRALQHCPWSKALYLDIVRYFPEEVEEIIDLLMEKELRVRVPLEEIELLMNASKRE